MAISHPILIVKTGSTHDHIRERLGDFEHWMASGLRKGGDPDIEVWDARGETPLPALEKVGGIVITGSHAMVSDREAWSEALVPWLQEAVRLQTPVLGICYGHQLLAHALGGEVGFHPGGVEIGTVTVQRNALSASDPLLGGLPEAFQAQASHWQSVRRLPPGAVLLAGNAFEPHHAFRIGPCAWGVQFHPEFSDEAVRAYLAGIGPVLAEAGRNAEAIAAAVEPTPWAASLLPNFARFAVADRFGHEAIVHPSSPPELMARQGGHISEPVP